jgi:formate dehydrogenase gamma subunit
MANGALKQHDQGKLTYERFNLHHRIQHFFLALSFTGLVLTGFPLLYPKLEIVQRISSFVGGVEVMGILHRIFGVTMIAVGIYHIVYLAVMFAKGQRSMAMMPGPRDVVEIFNDLKYFVGLSRERPKFGRYNWIDKFEYLAVVWGTVMMILTGLTIWFPQYVSRILPAWVVNASVIIHDYEALLAGLAIFLWHFYWVHLNPDVYPMSMVWLTGSITEDELKHHHALEYEEVLQRKAHPSAEPEPTDAGDPDPGEPDAEARDTAGMGLEGEGGGQDAQ